MVSYGVTPIIVVWIRVGQGPTALAVVARRELFGHFRFSRLSFLFSFSLSLGDDPIWSEILSQRAVIPKTTNQPATHAIVQSTLYSTKQWKNLQNSSTN